jgi:UDP-N-acetylmuramoyl-tripeptide--D-alanyl-D-alanine ligase
MTDHAFDLDFVLGATGASATAVHARGFTAVSIDGRAVPRGGLWFAIRGDRFDGHQFADQAIASGAAGLVVARGRAAGIAGAERLTVLEVDDTHRALAALAHAHRMRLGELRVVGVAGSNGKTTTKEMIAAILAASAGVAAVHKTEGNFNNHIGLPLTMLKLTRAHRFAVLEMGMSALGELAFLAELGRPDVAVVVSIGAEHLESLGTVENVVRAEAEIYGALGPRGVAVWPEGEERLRPFVDESRAARKLRFGRAPGAPVRVVSAAARVEGTDVVLRLPDGARVETRLGIVGIHNAWNAAAAAACACALGVAPEAIAAGLAEARTAKHRNAIVDVGGRHILDDCYNASPPSMGAALDTLADFARQSGKRGIAVLGDMLELGSTEAELHREVGLRAGSLGLHLVVGVGPRAQFIVEGARAAGMPPDRAIHVDELDDATWHARRAAGPGDWVLVKASRGARLERVVDGLRAHWQPPHQARPAAG